MFQYLIACAKVTDTQLVSMKQEGVVGSKAAAEKAN